MIQSWFRGGWIFRLHVAILLPTLLVSAYQYVNLALHPVLPLAISPVDYVAQLLAGLVLSPITVAVGLFCIRRVPGNVVGVLLALWGCYVIQIISGDKGRQPWSIGFEVLFAGILWPASFFLFSFFPDGTVFPRRFHHWLGGVVLLTYLTGLLAGMAHAIVPYDSSARIANPAFVPALLPLAPVLTAVNVAGAAFAIMFGLGSLAYRFRAAGQHVRQQIKWMLGGFAPFALVVPVHTILLNVTSLATAADVLGEMISLWLMVFPVIAIGNAILRHRLYDIDVIIRRTLVYGVLTSLLALTYMGSVIVLQTLLRPLIGGDSELVTIVSTLAIVALFGPLRHRVQATIDHRFYRRKYDAQQTLHAFGARLRDETNVDRLTDDMLTVVEQTLQPSHSSLWLREPSPARDQA